MFPSLKTIHDCNNIFTDGIINLSEGIVSTVKNFYLLFYPSLSALLKFFCRFHPDLIKKLLVLNRISVDIVSLAFTAYPDGRPFLPHPFLALLRQTAYGSADSFPAAFDLSSLTILDGIRLLADWYELQNKGVSFREMFAQRHACSTEVPSIPVPSGKNRNNPSFHARRRFRPSSL